MNPEVLEPVTAIEGTGSTANRRPEPSLAVEDLAKHVAARRDAADISTFPRKIRPSHSETMVVLAEAQPDVPQDVGHFHLSRSEIEAPPYKLIQRWEGFVSDIANDQFAVVLRDPTAQTDQSEIAHFPLTAVSEADAHLLKVGAIIYFLVGYELKGLRRKQLVSEVILRRAPRFSPVQISNALKRVKERKIAKDGCGSTITGRPQV
jgi:hypothetical protein